MKGYIYRIEKDRGFAFIRDEQGQSRFAHASQFMSLAEFDKIGERQAVEFTPDDSAAKGNGLRAMQVRVCSN